MQRGSLRYTCFICSGDFNRIFLLFVPVIIAFLIRHEYWEVYSFFALFSLYRLLFYWSLQKINVISISVFSVYTSLLSEDSGRIL